jgi:hypothetical protein
LLFEPLSEDDQKELWRLYALYWREARRCEKAGAHLAGCVMIGSGLETLLMLMVDVYPEEAERTGKLPTQKGKPKPLLEWRLSELLRVAKAAQWLPSGLELQDRWNSRKAKIGDYAEAVREIRNLVHPAAYRKDHYRKRVTARYLRRQFEIALASRDWLLARVHRSLSEEIDED